MKNSILFCSIFLASTLLLTGCKEFGTEGGNPGMHSGTEVPTNDGQAAAPTELSVTLCQKRQTCTGQLDTHCLGQILVQGEITNELRINPPYRNLKELEDAKKSAQVEESSAKHALCTKAITEMDCSSALGQQAFDIAGYDDIHLSLRVDISCTEIYTTK